MPVGSVFGLRRDEGRKALLLFTYLFLVLTSYVAIKATRDALFLERFGAAALPYADVAAAVGVVVAMSVYLRLGRHVRLPLLQSATLLAFAGLECAFWWLGRGSEASWRLPALYVSASVFGVLLPVQVWTLANHVVTTREAKRMFSLVASGAIGGWIVGGLITRAVARRAGTDALLLATAAALVICVGLVAMIWEEHRTASLPGRPAPADEESSRTSGLLASLQFVGRTRYLKSIALLVGFCSVVTTIASWQFKAVANSAIADADSLAAFFGTFNSWAGGLSLVTQLLVTTRLLRRHGVGVALLVVPFAMASSLVALALTGALWAAVLLKGTDQVLRYAIDRPATELLYIPLPAHDTFVAKSLIDTVVLRLGDTLGSAIVLVSLRWFDASPASLSAVTFVLVVVWAAMAREARRQYVGRLQTSILQHRLDSERIQAGVLERSAAQALETALGSGDAGDLLYALDLLKGRDYEVSEVSIRRLEELLSDPDPSIRTRALLHLTRLTDVDPLERLDHLDAVDDTSLQMSLVAYLSRPGPQQSPAAAHVLLETALEGGDLPPLNLARAFSVLPDDALEEMSDTAVPLVERLLDEPGTPAQARREAPALLLRIGTPAAERALVRHLMDADPDLRLAVVAALNKLRQRFPHRRGERELIETVLAAEILGHYRSYQLLDGAGDPIDLDAELERIFRLLKLLFPTRDLQSAYVGARSSDAAVHDQALEFLEHTLPPWIRVLLIPLIDRDVSAAERQARAASLVGTFDAAPAGAAADAALREAADLAREQLGGADARRGDRRTD